MDWCPGASLEGREGDVSTAWVQLQGPQSTPTWKTVDCVLRLEVGKETQALFVKKYTTSHVFYQDFNTSS